MNPLIEAVLLSMAPISELRGGLPWALSHGINPFAAYAIAVLANIIVVPIIFFFLESVHHYFTLIPIYKKIFDKFLERTRRKLHKNVEKYGYFGLTLFVAIPLPVTGAWTGTLGAWFFGMDKIKSFFAIVLGVLISGIIVTMVYFMGSSVLKLVLLKGF